MCSPAASGGRHRRGEKVTSRGWYKFPADLRLEIWNGPSAEADGPSFVVLCFQLVG